MTRRIALVGLAMVVACTSAGQKTESSPDVSPGSSVTAPLPGDHGLMCWSASPEPGPPGDIVFSDLTEDLGLTEPLKGLHGHAAIWTDIDGDSLQDLYVGTYADRDAERYQHRGANGPSPDRLLILGPAGFDLDNQLDDMFTRTSGGVTADLDGDGDLDLVLSRNYRDHIAGAPTTQVLRNDGGFLTPLDDTGLPGSIGARSIGVLDYDLDGLPDLFIAEDRWAGGSSVLLHNLGGMRFTDVTTEMGIPQGVHGLGVAVADLTGDRRLDLFVAGSNRLFVAADDGTFREADSSVFRWEIFGDEDDVAGISVADINRDGRLDLAIGHHYNSTVEYGARVPVRVYLNQGTAPGGDPVFQDVTEQSGLPGLATKAPHVELNDFDNDGWPDLLTSASAGNGSRPAVFRHDGLVDGVPRFSAPSGLGHAQYWVGAPTADIDRDGRLDVFLLEWEPALPSLLLGNSTSSGHWLEISVGPSLGFGLGWRVEVFEGDAATPEGLLGAREITVTQGYSSGVSPIAHFGLGDVLEVTVRLVPPGDADPIILDGIAADQHLRYPSGC